MPISVVCNQCSASFQVVDAFAGKAGKCPRCKAVLQVPMQEALLAEEVEPRLAPVAQHSASMPSPPTAKPTLPSPPASKPAVAVATAAGTASSSQPSVTKGASDSATLDLPSVASTKPAAKAPSNVPQNRDLLLNQVLNAFQSRIPQVETSSSYKIGIVLVSLVMLMLPLLYISLILLVAFGVFAHLVNDISLIGMGRGRGAIFALLLYLAPAFIGAILVFFMIKPLFARPGKKRGTRSLTREAEPVLFAFVDRICEAVGSARPSRIDVDCEVNATAGFKSGFVSMFTNDLVLTIGVPLAAGMNMRQFAGILAHEFGHFSQGAGMRLSFVIRNINFWFQRVVYERDAWDDWLTNSASGVDLRIGIFFYITMFFVWLTRKILWLLMIAGHAVSSFLMREMEFDADRYEARLAGSDTFETTCRRLLTLNVAHSGAQADLRELYRDGRLGDDLPKMIVANIEQIPPDVMKKIQKAVDESSTGWFDTHPADLDRIHNAQDERATGIFRLDWPATVLFTDFDSLSRNVTWDFYRSVFGNNFQRSEMHDTDAMLARLGKDQENNKSMERYFQGTYSLLRKLQIPYATPHQPLDPRRTLMIMKQSRQRVLELADEYHRCLKDFVQADDIILEAGQAYELWGANITPRQADFKAQVQSGPACLRSRENAQVTQGRLDPRMGPLEQAQGERLYAGLQLLFVPQVAARIENAAALQADIIKLYETLLTIMRYADTIVQLRNAQAALGILCAQLESHSQNQALILAIRKQMNEVYRLVAELRGELVNVEYPFDHAKGSTTIGRYCVQEMPLSDDLGALYNAGGNMLDSLGPMVLRIISRLASAAEKVETTVGLPQLEPRKSPEEGDNPSSP